jgi:hypothetical protein
MPDVEANELQEKRPGQPMSFVVRVQAGSGIDEDKHSCVSNVTAPTRSSCNAVTRISRGVAVLALVLNSSNAFCQVADRIFTGSNIVTVDAAHSEASAVAIADGLIIAVGELDEVMVHRGPDSKLVRLGRRSLLPGFIDSHGHGVSQAVVSRFANLAPPPVGKVRSIKDLQTVVREHIASQARADDDWVATACGDSGIAADRTYFRKLARRDASG